MFVWHQWQHFRKQTFFVFVFIFSEFMSCFLSRHLKQFGLLPNVPAAWWHTGFGIAAACIFGFLLVKVVHSSIRR